MEGVNSFVSDISPYFGGRKIVYVDIGAFRGEVYQALSSQGIGFKEAHFIEPNPQTFSALEAAFRDDPKIFVYNIALSAPSIESVYMFKDLASIRYTIGF